MKKNVSKRVLAMLVAVMMCLAMLPGTAMAEDAEDHEHNSEGWTCKTLEVLTCTQDVHTHTDSCYGLICGLEEHVHKGTGCGGAAVCEKEAHTHTDDCYGLTCGMSEHSHDSDCYGIKWTCTQNPEEPKEPPAECTHIWRGAVKVIEPTCTEPGKTIQLCAICGKEIATNVDNLNFSALGHEWSEWEVTTPATCETAGEETHTCSRCNETETREIASSGHAYGSFQYEDEDNHSKTCEKCDDVVSEAHNYNASDWSEWVDNSDGTESRTRTLTCDGCGDVKTETETRDIENNGEEETPEVPGGDDTTTTPPTGGEGDDTTTPPTGGDGDDTTTTPPAGGTTVTPPTGGTTVTPPTVTAPETVIDDNDTPLTGGTDAVDDAMDQQPDETEIADEETPLTDASDVDIADEETPLTDASDVDIADEETPLTDASELEIADEETPLAAEPDLGNAEVEINDGAVPMSDVPVTGDGSQIWTLSALLSAAGLLWLTLCGKKREVTSK